MNREINNIEWQSPPMLRFLVSLWEIYLIVAIVIVYFAIAEFKQQQRMLLSHQPLVNDFFFVDYYQIDKSSDRKYRYLPIKIVGVDDNNISYLAGSGGHSEPVRINEHIKFDAPMQYNYFKHPVFTVSLDEFSHWSKNGIIYDMARPNKFYINGWIVLSPAEVLRGKKLNADLRNQNPG